MPTTWTNYTPVSSASYTASTPVSSVSFSQLEPDPGFGKTPFGDPSTEEAGLKIHRRGFGSPTTKWAAG